MGIQDGMSRRDFLETAVAMTGAAGLQHVAAALGWREETLGIVPFSYHASQTALDDLNSRLANTRFPDPETVPDWLQGPPLTKFRALIQYWQKEYNWRRCEDTLNSFPQYRATIDELGHHFLHVRSPHSNALPLILSQGCCTVVDLLGIIGPLTDPTTHGGEAEDAFHVILPSLPGFAFSDKPTRRGWNVDRIARAWAELMQRLGYSHYVAQGGDWGSWIMTRLAQQHPPGLLGIHLNMPLVIPDPMPATGLSPEETRAADSAKRFRAQQFAYFEESAQKPQTLGYALADSPAGQAAWLYEQYQAHSDNRGDPESALTRDQMLNEITLYWLTDTAASSARCYFENARLGPNGGIVDIPVGCSIFPHEIYQAPRSWADAFYPRLMYWHVLDRGGHFAALEQSALFADEVRACFRPLRSKTLTRTS